ncbi:MAG: hypothetical protein U1E63_07410 [Burkholderiales bacterium]
MKIYGFERRGASSARLSCARTLPLVAVGGKYLKRLAAPRRTVLADRRG